MLLLLWGASGSGKTACIEQLRQQFPHLAIHDFDEVDIPPAPDQKWRHHTTEHWIQRAVAYQSEGRDMLLCGQVPYGEVLACPSAVQLDEIESCLLDCHDYERVERIRGRATGTAYATQDMLCWAAWLRMHALDPQWRPDVIIANGAPEMRWDRWKDWRQGEIRWCVEVIDTTGTDLATTVARVAAWIEQKRSPNEEP